MNVCTFVCMCELYMCVFNSDQINPYCSQLYNTVFLIIFDTWAQKAVKNSGIYLYMTVMIGWQLPSQCLYPVYGSKLVSVVI